jgi:hypothetical protein
MDESLKQWQANYVLRTLWMAAHGQVEWDVLKKPKNSRYGLGETVIDERRTYLTIYVPELPELGILEHQLRLWQEDYKALVLEQLSDFNRRELSAHLSLPRWGMVFYHHKPSNKLRKGYVSDELVKLGEKLVDMAEKVKRVEVSA